MSLLRDDASRTERRRPPRVRGPRWWRRLLRWLLTLRGSPAAIARGAAIGVFVAFTPLQGFQMILAVALATAWNANRVIAAALVWITNPLTIVPLYGLCYWVGSRFWAGPPLDHVREVLRRTVAGLARFDFWEIYDQFVAFLALGRDILIPLTIGGVLMGGLLAIPAYFVVLLLVRRLRQLHWPHPRELHRRR